MSWIQLDETPATRIVRSPDPIADGRARMSETRRSFDPSGPFRARITRTVPLEHGVRLELELSQGRLRQPAASPVRVRAQGTKSIA